MRKLSCQDSPTLLFLLYPLGSLDLVKHHLLLLHLAPLPKQVTHIAPILLLLPLQNNPVLSVDTIDDALEPLPENHLGDQSGVSVDEILDLLDLGPVFTPCEFFEISFATDLIVLQLQFHTVVTEYVGRVAVLLLDLLVLCLNREGGTSAAFTDLNYCSVLDILSENLWQLFHA
jgi:hypothetical protein